MDIQRAFEGDHQVPIVDFPYDEVRMNDDNSDEEKAEVRAKFERLVNDKVD